MRLVFRGFMLLLTSLSPQWEPSMLVHSLARPPSATAPSPLPRPVGSWCQVASQSSWKNLCLQLSSSYGYTPFYLFLIFIFCHLIAVLTMRTCKVVFTVPSPSSPIWPLLLLYLLPSPAVSTHLLALVQNPGVLYLSLFSHMRSM